MHSSQQPTSKLFGSVQAINDYYSHCEHCGVKVNNSLLVEMGVQTDSVNPFTADIAVQTVIIKVEPDPSDAEMLVDTLSQGFVKSEVVSENDDDMWRVNDELGNEVETIISELSEAVAHSEYIDSSELLTDLNTSPGPSTDGTYRKGHSHIQQVKLCVFL
eukprot:sb/3472903/